MIYSIYRWDISTAPCSDDNIPARHIRCLSVFIGDSDRMFVEKDSFSLFNIDTHIPEFIGMISIFVYRLSDRIQFLFYQFKITGFAGYICFFCLIQ